MRTQVLSENHYSSQVSKEVDEICKDFLQYEITYFNFSRFFDDGTSLCLVNKWDSLQYHCQKNYIICPPLPPTLLKRKHFFVLPAPENKYGYNKVLHEYDSLFNLGVPIYVVERHKGYIDLFIFGSTPNNNMFLTYHINNQELFNNLKFYFKEKARDLIKKSYQNRIILPKHMYANLYYSDDKPMDQLKEQDILIKKYFLSENKNHVISKRERDVIKHLANGLTIKEVAKELDISPRTVETYFNELKLKLGIERKLDIIQLLKDYNLFLN